MPAVQTTCPICGALVRLTEVHERSPFPFCSDRCRLVDLGRWLDERYGITPAAATDEEPAQSAAAED